MTGSHYETLLKFAMSHHGSQDDVTDKSTNTHLVSDLAAQPDDRFLSQMARTVFMAGFSWKVIEAKWPGFEEAFDGFDPHRVAFYSDDDLARLVSDTRIVRNGQKIKATLENARFVVETSQQAGGFGRFLADWPTTDQIGLMAHLNKHGSRLGGMTAQYFLRFTGWDAFILSKDVVAALIRDGVIDKAPTSKAALRAVQDRFNELTAETGRPQSEISRLMAFSVG